VDGKGQIVTKTAFILSKPFDIPAKAVVRDAIGEGIKISSGYVHIVRSAARKRGLTTVRMRGQKVDARSKRSAPTSDVAREFDRLALRLGYDAARERLEALLEVNA
jgi:hypothetical protein